MSFTYTGSSAPKFARVFPLVGVFRMRTPTGGGSPEYTLLPNVEVLQIAEFEGPHPGTAQFRYKLGDPLGDPDDPQRIEDVYPLSVPGSPRVVVAGDELVVRLYSSDGSTWSVIFDGYALIPQVESADQKELATFEALGAPIREWDHPIGGAYCRNCDAPNTVSDVPTDIRTRFNPSGEPNRIPSGMGTEDSDPAHPDNTSFPTFLDVRFKRDPDVREYWTLSDVVRYVLFYCKVTNFEDPKKPPTYIIDVPTDTQIKTLLDSREPKPDPDGVIDPNDSSTYTDKPIEVSDVDITGDVWPEALEKLIFPHGFGFCFRLSTDEDGDPSWKLDIYRKDTPIPIKTLYMQPADPTVTYVPTAGNVHEISLQRDVRNVVNQIFIDTALRQYEVSIVLAPGFHVAAGDELLTKWAKGDPDFDPVGYRVFVFDETGDGHWDFDRIAHTGSWIPSTVTSLDDIIGKKVKGVAQYVNRPRPASAKLLTVDDDGEPLRAELRVSIDYAGDLPGQWDGTGTWHKVARGGWSVLDDRLGIELTMEDPTKWNIGTDEAAGSPFSDGKLDVVGCLANPDSSVTFLFFFMLTCVIESDHGLDVFAKRRMASPVPQGITRRVDGGDRWVTQTVKADSWYSTPGAADEDTRDDTDDAKAFSMAYRKAHELGAVAGTITYKRLTNILRIGDRIDNIAGREIDLTENAGLGGGEGETYPCVVGRTWLINGDGGPATILALSDRRSDPPPEKREASRGIHGAR